MSLFSPKRIDDNKFKAARESMVTGQIEARGISDPRVLEAFRTVPRHMFVDPAIATQAYTDNPLPIGKGQTISQPYMVAIMVDALKLKGGERVLEIGTGIGYAAAIISRIAKTVYTIERIASFTVIARNNFQKLGYKNIEVKVGDGTLGWPEYAPFDGIVVSAGAPEVPETLTSQLAEGGRLVIPVGDSLVQELYRITKENSKLKTENLGGCRFVKLVGEKGWR